MQSARWCEKKMKETRPRRGRHQSSSVIFSQSRIVMYWCEFWRCPLPSNYFALSTRETVRSFSFGDVLMIVLRWWIASDFHLVLFLLLFDLTWILMCGETRMRISLQFVFCNFLDIQNDYFCSSFQSAKDWTWTGLQNVQKWGHSSNLSA